MDDVRHLRTIPGMTAPRATPSARAFLALLPDLRRSARRLARSAPDADDLVQETLLRVWTRLAIFDQNPTDAAPVTDMRAYAFATLRNVAHRQRATPIQGDTAPEPRTSAHAATAHIAVAEAMTALGALPRDQADIIRLRALDGLSYADIARQTGLPMGTVTSRLSRARAALRRQLGLPRGTPISELFRPE